MHEFWVLYGRTEGRELIQQCRTRASGRVYRPTSVQIILSHKLGKPNIWDKEEVVSLPVKLMFLGPSYRSGTWHSSVQQDTPLSCTLSGIFMYCLRAPLHMSWFYVSFSASLCFSVSLVTLTYFVFFFGFHYCYFAFYTLLLFFPLSFTYSLSTSSFLQSLTIDQLLLHFNLLTPISSHLPSLPFISHLYLRSTVRLW